MGKWEEKATSSQSISTALSTAVLSGDTVGVEMSSSVLGASLIITLTSRVTGLIASFLRIKHENEQWSLHRPGQWRLIITQGKKKKKLLDRIKTIHHLHYVQMYKILFSFWPLPLCYCFIIRRTPTLGNRTLLDHWRPAPSGPASWFSLWFHFCHQWFRSLGHYHHHRCWTPGVDQRDGGLEGHFCWFLPQTLL